MSNAIKTLITAMALNYADDYFGKQKDYEYKIQKLKAKDLIKEKKSKRQKRKERGNNGR